MYIVIIGCGRVGSELARLLSTSNHNVVVIDKDEGAFSRLGAAFNGMTIKGSGISTKTLQEAGIEKAHIFCALTDSDTINIMASQVAKGIFKVSRVIARDYDPQKADIYKKLGLDVLSETNLFASLIRDKVVDPLLSGYLIESRELGVLEFISPLEVVGKTIEEVNIPGEMTISAIRPSGKPVLIPDAKTTLNKGDLLIAVVRMDRIKEIKKRFNLEE
jgi:trk system potassium uptake protein TrkA